MIAKNRISSGLWRRVYMWMAAWSFKKLAAKNGIGKDKMLARPYAA